VLDPTELGIAPATIDELQGGDVARNRELADDILAGAVGARSDLVALNAAAALLVADVVPDLAAGLARARDVLAAGAAREVLDRWVEVSQRENAASGGR
jgi:anthranilate phosphoribosyltransferase